ncbi:adenine phosphoribosyltransferase [Lindgomyces ingoldianus]|uniref:Adenine phosphoribosyltransferase n=1 Tax=Lindgomyces ingoldianus TaxID=673940 RepID=A0ACB6QG15_9PLEO|nr:adenine phosphoribosyltransferase [Lindgomyces ingoldianus]KAF2465297.1 adenine phosphoribosyltransferase [Lindgomyces ingoldianus]
MPPTTHDNTIAKPPTKPSATAEHPPLQKPDPTLESNNAREGRLPSTASSRAPEFTSPAISSELNLLTTRLRGSLRQFEDFPSPGIIFEDIFPIFADCALHGTLIRALELHVLQAYEQPPDVVVGLDARGFLFGPSLALRLGAGFVPVRKRGKLPGKCETASFVKEYGEDYFQMQSDAVKRGQKVLVVDDIIATGGSAAAAGSLVKKLGGELLGYVFILELDFLQGRAKLDAPVYTLLSSQAKS